MGETTKEMGEKMRKKILRTIIGYIECHGYPPTQADIAFMVGSKSVSSVHFQIKHMITTGELETDEDHFHNTRAIRVPGYRFVKEERKHPLRDKTSDNMQGHCQCGRIVYSEFARCPVCENKIDWEAEPRREVAHHE